MSGENDGERMHKQTNQRQQSAVQRNSNDVSRNQRSGRSRGNGNSGANYSYNEGPSRKPTSQKNKNTWDKRPRPRSDVYARGRSNLEDDDLAEYGAAIQTGSKKGNLNHLLNFTFEQRESSMNAYRGGNAGWTRGRHTKSKGGYFRGNKVYYNKETYLQANCQFLVKKGGDYHIHMMDPDVLVDWEAVEQVRVNNTEEPSCPICLQYPKAAKMTRCGHIYCWACILHYLALGEKTWRKCPICYESIHSDDLKSVDVMKVDNYKVGDSITMTLMKKEKGSIYAVPANSWAKQLTTCHNMADPKEVTCHQKLLSVTRKQVLDILQVERDHLMVQRVDAEASEEPFIKGALDQLKARELKIQESFRKKSETIVEPDQVETEVDPVVPTSPVKHSPDAKRIKQYKDAFDDEVEEIKEEIQEKKEEQEPVTDQIGSVKVSPMQTEDKQSSPIEIETRTSLTPLAESAEEETNPSSPTELDSFTVGSPESRASPIEVMADGLQVEEAAMHLELPPTQGEHSDRSRNGSGDNCFYFYQAEDGQQVFLHSLNARCLVKEYGSLQNSPQTITGEIVEKESGFVSDELRKRLRYLSHLPVTCSFDVTELVLKPPTVSKETLKCFNDDIEKRRRNRQRKSRDEKRIARKIEEHDRKKLGLSTGFRVKSEFQQSGDRQSDTRSDTRSDTSSPTLDTPVGSPSSGLNVNAAEFTPGASSSASRSPNEDGDGSQTTVISFAQMIRGGAKATVWPKAKGDTSQSARQRQPSGAQSKGSDDSDNEDRVPVPQYQQSFGSDIQAALENIERKTQGTPPQASSNPINTAEAPRSSGKKKKKQLVLFSTSMARGGN